jgi:hypothetical protein
MKYIRDRYPQSAALCVLAAIIVAASVISSDDAEAGRITPSVACSKTASAVSVTPLGQKVTYAVACTFTPPAPGPAAIIDYAALPASIGDAEVPGLAIESATCQVGAVAFPAQILSNGQVRCLFPLDLLNGPGVNSFSLTIEGHYGPLEIGTRVNVAEIFWALSPDFLFTQLSIELSRFTTVFLPGPLKTLFEELALKLPPPPAPPPFGGFVPRGP